MASENTSQSIADRITEMKKQHREEANRLYDMLAEDYLGDATDAYYNVDDTLQLDEVDVRLVRTMTRIPLLIPLRTAFLRGPAHAEHPHF